MSLSIRFFSEDDLNKVSEIETISFPDPWPRNFFMYMHQKAPDLFLIALEGEKIRGFVIGELREVMLSGLPHRFKVGHILNIAVDKTTRQRGLGGRLMEEIERRFKERNAARSTLEVRESNSTARSFYLHRGYQEIGRVKSYYLDEDAIIMSKNL